MAKIMVNVQCPVCNFFHCLGSVEGEAVGAAMTGTAIPFRVDYRLWSGGRARGITQKETLTQGMIPSSLYSAWRSFVGRIEAALKAVETVVYKTPAFIIVQKPGDFVKVFNPGRLVRE